MRAHVPAFANSGSHLFCVTGRDAAGNVSAPSCVAVSIAASAVFVSKSGNDLNPGTMAAPKLTITAGILRAESLSVPRVNVAQGSYPEKIELKNGVSLYGGYDPSTWARFAAVHNTTIGPAPSDTAIAIRGDSVFGVTIDGFTIIAGTAAVIEESAFGIALVSSNVTINNNLIVVGNGANAQDGSEGIAGENGVNGFPGRTVLVAQAGRACVTVRRSRVARAARVAQQAPIPVTPASRASDQAPGRAVPAARAVWSVNLVATATTPWMERRAQRGPAAHRSAA